jgi:hypothetical protein
MIERSLSNLIGVLQQACVGSLHRDCLILNIFLALPVNNIEKETR